MAQPAERPRYSPTRSLRDCAHPNPFARVRKHRHEERGRWSTPQRRQFQEHVVSQPTLQSYSRDGGSSNSPTIHFGGSTSLRAKHNTQSNVVGESSLSTASTFGEVSIRRPDPSKIGHPHQTFTSYSSQHSLVSISSSGQLHHASSERAQISTAPQTLDTAVSPIRKTRSHEKVDTLGVQPFTEPGADTCSKQDTSNDSETDYETALEEQEDPAGSETDTDEEHNIENQVFDIVARPLGGLNLQQRRTFEQAALWLRCRQQIGQQRYPHVFVNRENLPLRGPAPHYIFPLLPCQQVYDGSQEPGFIRVVLSADYGFVNIVCHAGANGEFYLVR
ncbi:hypothetical protein LTS08_005168 [Lithohypha guttulata]|nr:hypothetical protein LTS08_005168 [Lithohypha guttulata]